MAMPPPTTKNDLDGSLREPAMGMTRLIPSKLYTAEPMKRGKDMILEISTL